MSRLGPCEREYAAEVLLRRPTDPCPYCDERHDFAREICVGGAYVDAENGAEPEGTAERAAQVETARLLVAVVEDREDPTAVAWAADYHDERVSGPVRAALARHEAWIAREWPAAPAAE